MPHLIADIAPDQRRSDDQVAYPASSGAEVHLISSHLVDA
jgi:hypothetical protein